jgi:hypothetical protein
MPFNTVRYGAYSVRVYNSEFLLGLFSSRGLVSGGLITTSTTGLGHLKVCLPTTPVPVAALCLPTTPVPVAALGGLSPRPPPPPILHRLVAPRPPSSSPPSSNLVKLGQFPRPFSCSLWLVKGSVADPWHFGVDQWIRIRIRIRGFMTLTNRSGFGSGDQDPSIFIIDLQDANKKLI